MNFNEIEGLSEKQILEVYDEIVEYNGEILLGGCNHLIRCDNGKEGYFCLRGASCGSGTTAYGCEYPTQWNCYTQGSIGCYCGEGYRCGYMRYAGSC